MPPQASGIAIVCALLYLEEAGLPLPVAPGEAVLIGAGLLIATGGVPAWLIVPLAYFAVLCGILTAYAWARWIGPDRIHAFAVRLHAAGPYDRAADRLRAASPRQIAASRLLPGLRVYTSLVAGAVGLKLGRFMLGAAPASAIWLVAFIGLGVFFGAPVERLLGPFQAYALRAVVVVAVAALWLVAARRMPATHPASAPILRRGKWRLGVAFGLDLFVIGDVAGFLSLFTGVIRGDTDQLVFAAATFAILGALYLVVARQTVGYTLGEALLEVRYHRPRLPTLRASGQENRPRGG
jgi:membrane protein DedA with SNARE-associated domain